MGRKQEMNEFIAEYVNDYDGDSYEASAEQEDIAVACKSSIQWADKTMIDKVCKWLEQKTKGVKFVCGNCNSAKEFIQDIKEIMEA